MATAPDDELGPLIRVLAHRRRELGLSQDALDSHVGLCSGHVAKWESGQRRPTGYLLAVWAMALGMSLTVTLDVDSTATRAALAAANTEQSRHGLTACGSRRKPKPRAT